VTTDVTRILCAIELGNPRAAAELLPLVYDELRKLAAARLAREQPGQTIQATALVHEAYLRLVGAEHQQRWESQGHFFAAAAQAMRRILVENARRRNSLKRGGGRPCVDVELDAIEASADDLDLLALDQALSKLGTKDPRKAKLVELRFFSGLTLEQAASALGVSVATAQRDWTYARAWLHREIAAEEPFSG
jgi:RNA polymerase sigma factor (TIGR02999 family)